MQQYYDLNGTMLCLSNNLIESAENISSQGNLIMFLEYMNSSTVANKS